MFEFTLKIDPAVAELLGLDGDSIIEAFYDPDEDEIVIRVLDEDELDGEFNFWASAPMISSAFEPRVMRSSSAERRSATIAAPASIGQMRPPLLRHCAVSFPLCLPMFRRRPSSI